MVKILEILLPIKQFALSRQAATLQESNKEKLSPSVCEEYLVIQIVSFLV